MASGEWVDLRDLHDEVERLLKTAPRMHALCCNFYLSCEAGEKEEAEALRALQAAISAKVAILQFCFARIEKGLASLESLKGD